MAVVRPCEIKAALAGKNRLFDDEKWSLPPGSPLIALID